MDSQQNFVETIKSLEMENEHLRSQLSRSSTLSEETKKALFFEVTEKTQEQSRNFLFIWLSVITLLFSFLAFLGYENIQRTAVAKIPIERIKNQILEHAQEQIDELSKSKDRVVIFEEKINKELGRLLERTNKTNEHVAEIKGLIDKARDESTEIHRSKLRIDSLEQQIRKELSEVNLKSEKTNIAVSSLIKAIEEYKGQGDNIIAKIQRLTIENESIKESLPEEQQKEIRRTMQDKHLSLFGLTDRSVSLAMSSLLGQENKNISLSRDLVSGMQNKLRLIPDGGIGPATALMVATIAFSMDPEVVKEDLAQSKFHSNKRLERIFSATYKKDKETISKIFKQEHHPLHAPLLSVINYSGINQKTFIESLNLHSNFSFDIVRDYNLMLHR